MAIISMWSVHIVHDRFLARVFHLAMGAADEKSLINNFWNPGFVRADKPRVLIYPWFVLTYLYGLSFVVTFRPDPPFKLTETKA